MFQVINKDCDRLRIVQIDYREKECTQEKIYIASGNEEPIMLVKDWTNKRFYWVSLPFNKIGTFKSTEHYSTIAESLKWGLSQKWSIFGFDDMDSAFEFYRKCLTSSTYLPV